MAYVEQSEMTDYLRSTIVADEVDIQAAILAAESTIDAYCGRTFTVPTTATARTFVVSDPYVVNVPDIANTTNLAIVDNGTTISASYFQMEIAPGVTGPISVSGRTWPYTSIRRLSGTWYHDSYGNDSLSITARWGWAAIPPEIPQATKLLARDFLLARDMAFGIMQTGDGFSRLINGNSVVKGLLAPLRRAEVAMGIAG
jgi:hypothetical protein